MRYGLPSIATCLLLLLCQSAGAQMTTVYRCEDASGHISLQGTPCPPGSRERERSLRTPAAPMPPPILPAPILPAPIRDVAPEPAPIADAMPRPGPPPLYQCVDYDGARRISESVDPRRRCIPLAATGMDLRGAPPDVGAMCTWVEERCSALPERQLCRAWRERLVEAERAERTAFSDTLAEKRAELARVRAIMRDGCR